MKGIHHSRIKLCDHESLFLFVIEFTQSFIITPSQLIQPFYHNTIVRILGM